MRGLQAGLRVDVHQCVGLRHALARRIELKVSGHDAHRAPFGLHRGTGAHAWHGAHTGISRIRQWVMLHLCQWQAGGHQIAKALALAIAPHLVHRRTKAHLETRQKLTQSHRLVKAGIALQARIVHRHFLQAKHVKVSHGAGLGHDAFDADDIVKPAKPLNIPGDEFH